MLSRVSRVINVCRVLRCSSDVKTAVRTFIVTGPTTEMASVMLTESSGSVSATSSYFVYIVGVIDMPRLVPVAQHVSL